MIDQPIDDETAQFLAKAERALRSLFQSAREKNELHFALAMHVELRGARDAGWSTADDAKIAFDQYLEFLNAGDPTPLKTRVALAFYSHLAEASGLYELPKNLLRIVGGSSHVLWPFAELVETHRLTGEKIAPNSNRVIRDLVGHAESVGLHELAEVLRDVFDPELRNGYAHADYVLWSDGIRLPKRNGGRHRVVSFEEFNRLFVRGINFFNFIRQLNNEAIWSYDPPRTIRGALSNSPEMNWTISFDPSLRSFKISGTG